MAAFITPSELYSYQVMPSGLRNAPAMFQNVVAGLAGCVYLDDVVVYSDSCCGLECCLIDQLR